MSRNAEVKSYKHGDDAKTGSYNRQICVYSICSLSDNFFTDIKENQNNNKHNQFGGKVIDLLDWKSKQQALGFKCSACNSFFSFKLYWHSDSYIGWHVGWASEIISHWYKRSQSINGIIIIWTYQAAKSRMRWEELTPMVITCSLRVWKEIVIILSKEIPKHAPGITRTPQNYTPDSQ